MRILRGANKFRSKINLLMGEFCEERSHSGTGVLFDLMNSGLEGTGPHFVWFQSVVPKLWVATQKLGREASFHESRPHSWEYSKNVHFHKVCTKPSLACSWYRTPRSIFTCTHPCMDACTIYVAYADGINRCEIYSEIWWQIYLSLDVARWRKTIILGHHP